jgi:chromatin remodeling complex protein RSC6
MSSEVTKEPTEIKKSNVKTIEEITLQFDNILSTLVSFKNQITMAQQQIKQLERDVKKNMKVYAKEINKNKNKKIKKPSGFASPTKVSNDLCEFMNKPVGSQIARTEVTQYIAKYIKDQQLQNKDNKRIIRPDAKLKSLLDPPQNTNVTYFNLQTLMNKHFKETPAKNQD